MFIIPRRSLKSGGAITTPTITGISPNVGAAGGGTSVVITGTNFTGATAVSFGGNAAASYTVNSATQITATTAAHAAGAGDVVVTTPSGSATVTGGFTFSSGSYVGPGDIAGFTGNVLAYWGMRAVDNAYAATTGPLADYVRDDAATYTLHCLSNGMPDQAGYSSWLGAHTAEIVKIYNQKASGACPLLKDNVNTFPFMGPDGVAASGASGGYPGIGFLGVQTGTNNRVLQGTGLPAHALPVTLSYAGKMTGAGDGYYFDVWDSTAAVRELGLQLFQDYGGVRMLGAADYSHFFTTIGTNHASVSMVYQATAPTMDNNGDQQTGSNFGPSAIGAGAIVILGMEKPLSVGVEQPVHLETVEVMLTAGAVSFTNMELLRANQQAAGVVT